MIEYSTFLNLPLDECIVNTPQSNQKRTKREAKTEKNKEEVELERSKSKSLDQENIDPLRQGQRLDAIDQKPKHDSSKTEVKLDLVMLEVEGKRGKPGARNKADIPQAKLFPLTIATLTK